MRSKTVLGIDFGERRIGIALSDPDRFLATGYTTLDRREHPDILSALAKIIDEESVGHIVVGYPLRTDGKVSPGDKTEAVDAFISSLESRFTLPVDREDEAFTSSLAQDSLRQRGGSKAGGKANRKKRQQDKAAIDRVAACFILQDWLDRQGSRT